MTGSSTTPSPPASATVAMSGSGTLAVGGFRLSARAVGFAAAPVPVSVDSLFASAVKQAQRGLRARQEQDHDDAAYHLGAMVEHLLKAVLVNLSPVLILDKNPDFNSMLKLAGQGQRAKPDHVLRTVGFDEALTRVAQVVYSIGPIGTAWINTNKPIGAARNGAAHLGESPTDHEQITQLAVACAKDLLPRIGKELPDLFAGYTDTAQSLIEANTTEMERAVRSTIDTARTDFRNKYGETPTPETERLLGLIDAQAMVLADDQRTTTTCPACRHTAIVSGYPFLDYPDGFDTEPETPDTELHVMLAGERLDCPTCHLRLFSTFELFFAGIETAFDLRPSTSQDRDRYPDANDLWIGLDDEDDLGDDDDQPGATDEP